MPRAKREVPWLEPIGETYYVHWYDAAGKRTKRVTTGTSDPVAAAQFYARFITNGHDTLVDKGSAGLMTTAALDFYLIEHVETKCVDKDRQKNAAKHLKAWFGDTPIIEIDIPASRIYALARGAGVIGGGKRRGRTGYVPAFMVRLREYKAALEKAYAEAAARKAQMTVQDAFGIAMSLSTRSIDELNVCAASASTIRRELVVLNAAAEHNAEWKRIGTKATPPTSMPSLDLPSEVVNEEVWLTQSEVALAIEQATGRLKDFITLLYYTGARRRSIEHLTRFQVKLQIGQINLRSPKETQAQRQSKKRRGVVPIFPEIRPIVERLMEDNKASEWLFGNGNRDMYRPFVKHLTALGLDYKACHPHVMRHSRATHLLQDGVDIYDVARLLGDTVATIERVYGHHSAEFVARAIERKRA